MDSNSMNAQVAAIKSAPTVFYNNIGASITFAVVDYIAAMVINVLPSGPGGTLGQVYSSLVTGAAQVLQFATWDAFKASKVA
jgi:hypothetical protein